MFWAVLCAVAAAGANAAATVLQRQASLRIPAAEAFTTRFVDRLLHSPTWLISIPVICAAAVLQALALMWGPMSLVQPILVLELPLTLVIAHLCTTTAMPRGGWWASTLTAAGLALALTCAAPREGSNSLSTLDWAVAMTATLLAIALCTAAALGCPRGKLRAALLATASAIAYGLTALLMKAAMTELSDRGAAALATAWQTYMCVASGGLALLLLAHAMQAGPLTASQPAVTLGEAGASLALGITFTADRIRTGWWLLPTTASALLTAYGILLLARLPVLATRTTTESDDE
ncbi:DMT family transporter [Streptomyces luteolus]|uniref:DMT family transporter n=1 Tax=Streptomyces luteolus TaxID=3043615 RepID=A0ABT6T1C7_9ACTN|nr:DMT family transporter [Streptomyces sp. B-S-A12]MDI3421667.1 DMT family transporter [Streptomyces sp. B-S-A12]